MNANISHAAAAGDDLVIEEFGRHAVFGQVPMPCLGSGVAHIPAAATADTARLAA
ncbi:hypothetical protein [Streptomyces sp. NPDC048111]|uniref:hypothetical protein n=1 Tax=Streptomyces sp. NPDC048111 TaxID=3365500 RepID=UPI00371045C0